MCIFAFLPCSLFGASLCLSHLLFMAFALLSFLPAYNFSCILSFRMTWAPPGTFKLCPGQWRPGGLDTSLFRVLELESDCLSSSSPRHKFRLFAYGPFARPSHTELHRPWIGRLSLMWRALGGMYMRVCVWERERRAGNGEDGHSAKFILV